MSLMSVSCCLWPCVLVSFWVKTIYKISRRKTQQTTIKFIQKSFTMKPVNFWNIEKEETGKFRLSEFSIYWTKGKLRGCIFISTDFCIIFMDILRLFLEFLRSFCAILARNSFEASFPVTCLWKFIKNQQEKRV